MPNFLRHDLVWLNNVSNPPFIVTFQRSPIMDSLTVAKCTTPDKAQRINQLLQVPLQDIIEHTKPPLFTTLLEAALTNLDTATYQIDKSLLKLPCVKLQQNYSKIQEILYQMSTHLLDLRVFGSCMWQYYHKTNFIHADSDIDILIYITRASQLEILAQYLPVLEALTKRRLDGELVFSEHYFVAWREWFNHKPQILVKTTTSVDLKNKHELIQLCQT